MQIKSKFLFLMIMSLSLTACERSRDILGFNRVENDAFAVNITPELTLPEDFEHLPSPVKQFSEVHQNSNEDARKTAMEQFSSSIADEATPQNSYGEVELLKKANAGDNDPEIRHKLYQDAELKKTSASGSMVQKILGIEDSKNTKSLDPFQEKKRLDQAHDPTK